MENIVSHIVSIRDKIFKALEEELNLLKPMGFMWLNHMHFWEN